jgi:hypothetical protein
MYDGPPLTVRAMPVRFAPVLFSCLAAGVGTLAVAQPVADGAGPTALSGVTVTATRKATPLSPLTVAALANLTLCRKPNDGVWPSYLFDQSAKVQERRADPSPGTADYVRTDVAAIQMGTRDYPHMTAVIARNAQRQLPVLEQRFKCLGAFRSISFLHVSDANFDDYEIEFENGALEATIAPLDDFNRSRAQYLRFYEPQPVTTELGELIVSLQKDRPDRRAISAEFAPELEDRWPILRQKFAGWGRLESVDFVRKTETGAYIYLVALGRGRPERPLKTAWSVTVDPADSKLDSLTYAFLSGGGRNQEGVSAGAADASNDLR